MSGPPSGARRAELFAYHARPGAGLVVLLVALALGGAFFAWGLRTPPLERAWRTSIELMVGRRPVLRPPERRAFARALLEHPAIAEDLLDGASFGLVSAHREALVEAGAAYFVRRAREGARTLVLTPGGASVGDEVALSVRTEGLEETGAATAAAPMRVALPDGPYPQLVEIAARGRGATAPGFVVSVDDGSPPGEPRAETDRSGAEAP